MADRNHCPISAAVFKQLRKNNDYIKNEGLRKRSGLKAPAQPSSLAAELHSLLFQYLPQWRVFILNKFYLKALHRRKAISGTSIIQVINTNLDFIAILFLTGGLKATAKRIMVSVDF